jgi:hypothetical protein
MTFQSIVVIASIIILTIALIVIGISLKMAKTDVSWPPLIGDCPDYWLDRGEGGSDCVVNQQGANQGTATSPMNFSVSPYNGSNGNCQKYRWATNNNVSWDGITYGVQNPCVTSDSTIEYK